MVATLDTNGAALSVGDWVIVPATMELDEGGEITIPLDAAIVEINGAEIFISEPGNMGAEGWVAANVCTRRATVAEITARERA